MIWTLGLDPSRGQYPALPGRNGFLIEMECLQQGSNIKVHIHLFWIFQWHSWGEYLYITLCTPALGTEPQICTHMHAHLVVRVKRMDGAHTSPNSIPSCEVPISNPRIPMISPQHNSRVRIKSQESKATNSKSELKCKGRDAKDQMLRVKGKEPKVNNQRFRINSYESNVNKSRDESKGK